jgi:hypothetical protein
VSWSGDASEVLNPIYVTMTANKSVTANFGYPLSVVKAGIGLYILKNCLLKSKISNCPTQRAPDPRQITPGLAWWESARFQAVFLA